MVKGVYHTQDPVENLKIRINLREVSSSHSLANNNTKHRPLFDQIIEFSWQEKIYGPRDVADYMLHKKSSYGRQTQLDSRRNLGNLERSGVRVESLLSEVMIYSYCNDEPFYPPQRSIVEEGGSSAGFDSYLSHAQEPSPAGAEDRRQQRVGDRLKRAEDAAKHMQICLATGIKKDAAVGAITSDLSECVLCSIKLMKSGLLVVSPGFSHIIPEEAPVLHYDAEEEDRPGASTSSLFMNNATISAGLQQGFRLSTHRVRTSAGEEFEFSVENVNGVLSPVEAEELMTAELRKDLLLSEQSRGTSRQLLAADDPDQLNKWNHSPLPAPYNQLTSLYAEIVSASGFDCSDPMYVRYQLLLPGDKTSCSLRTSFEAPKDGGGGAEDGVLSPLHKHLPSSGRDHASQGAGRGGGAGHGETAVDLVGHTQLSTGVSGQEPQCMQSQQGGRAYRMSAPPRAGLFLAANPSARFLMGLVLMVSSALTVFFGPGYPFWLVPALTFWVYLLPGSLPPNTQVTVLSGLAESSPLATSAAAGSGRPALLGLLVSDDRAVFGHAFQCDVYLSNPSLVAHATAAGAPPPAKHESPSASQATLFFEVFSVNMFKRHTLEGCGYTHVPLLLDGAGGDGERGIDVDVSTWKPIGDHTSRLVDAFLGGGAHLSNVRFMEVPNKASSALSKFGTRTESAGSVRFKCRTVMYAPAPGVTAFAAATASRVLLGDDEGATLGGARRGGQRAAGGGGGAGASGVPKRTVEDILNSYKSSELLSRSISRSTLRSSQGQASTPLKGLSLWGSSSDGGLSQDDALAAISVDRVADIVARARANTEELRRESKGEQAPSSSTAPASFNKPRGVPRPREYSDSLAASKSKSGIEQQAKQQQHQSPSQPDAGENEHSQGAASLGFSEDEGQGQSGSEDESLGQRGGARRYESSEDEGDEAAGGRGRGLQEDSGSGAEDEGLTLLDRFEAAGVTKAKSGSGRAKKRKEKVGVEKQTRPQLRELKPPSGGGGGGILLSKPPQPLSGPRDRGSELSKIFGSDSESEEQDSNNHKSKKLGPLQGQGLGQAALSPLHR